MPFPFPRWQFSSFVLTRRSGTRGMLALATLVGLSGLPEASLALALVHESHLTVYGEVERPGKYQLGGEATVGQQVLWAGGLTARGNQKSVGVYRKYSADCSIIAIVNLQRILKGGCDRDIQVFPGDVIIVGKRPFWFLHPARNPAPSWSSPRQMSEQSSQSRIIFPRAMSELDNSRPLLKGDLIFLRLVEDDRTYKLSVQDSGDVSVPYLGLVKSEGRTPLQLARLIKAELENTHFKRATVFVVLDTIGWKPPSFSRPCRDIVKFSFIKCPVW